MRGVVQIRMAEFRSGSEIARISVALGSRVLILHSLGDSCQSL